jgi:hypothetical protein
MSTPEPTVPPPPPSNAKKWFIGCAIALLLLVLVIIGVAVAIIYAAKKQAEAISSNASHLVQDAKNAASMLESAKSAAPDIAQMAQARMRLGRAAAAVGFENPVAGSCPAELARAALPVDAIWFAGLVNGMPAASEGTPWMRDPAITTAANGTDPQQVMLSLDRELAAAGAVAAIHATQLTDPAVGGGGGKFEGSVQLLGYPDGETVCRVSFHAEGATASEFQSSFWSAEAAALGK